MIAFLVDRRSGWPAYLQLAGQVREALRTGVLRPGEQLPTVRDVVAVTGVNPNTVVRAYRELQVAGLLESRAGSGTFVVEGLPEEDHSAVLGLRRDLQNWLTRAEKAGLDRDDLEALFGSVLAEASTTARRGR